MPAPPKPHPRHAPGNPALVHTGFARPGRRLVLLLTGLSLLAGCGFELRGNAELPAALAQVHVTGAERELVGRLADALTQSGAAVTDAGRAARIDITQSRFERDTLTTDADGRATAYALRYEIAFSVTAGDGAPLSPPQSLSLRRAYEYDPTRELQAEEEENFLKTEMRREAVTRILRRLSSL